MKFLRVYASDGSKADVVEIGTLEELLAHLDDAARLTDRGAIIVSRKSIVSDSHDRLREAKGCSYILTIYDSWVE